LVVQNCSDGGIDVVATTLTISNSIITRNSYYISGGGIRSSGGITTLINTNVNNNQSNAGGGVAIVYSGTLTLINSTVYLNSATIHGGGIYNNGGTVTLNSSAITNNTATNEGGGIFNFRSTVIINNSTISGNVAGTGGGIANSGWAGTGDVHLYSSTIVNNTGGGIDNYFGATTLQNTILAGNGSLDCRGQITSEGNNLIGDSSGCSLASAVGDLINYDAKIGSLTGLSGYHPLLSGSPAINAGDPTGCKDSGGNVLTVDQRGVARPQGAACDIGAYESILANLTITMTDSPDPIFIGDTLTYTVRVTNSGSSLVTNVTLTDTLPSGAVFNSATPSQGACAEIGGIVNCNLGTLANGANAQVVLVVTQTRATTPVITNTVIFDADPVVANNVAVQTTTVTPTDIVVAMTDTPDPMPVGQPLTYTIVVSNTGPLLATGVTLNDVLSSGVVYGSASSSCAFSGGIISCNLGELAVAASRTLTIAVTPIMDGIITNTVSVVADQPDPTPLNNTATESTAVYLYYLYVPLVARDYCPDFFDDFSNPSSGWSVGEDEYVRVEYLSGEYRVLSKNGDYIYLFRAPACARQNYTVEMDARWVGGTGDSYGLLFGITGNFSQYYMFDMNTDYQMFRLYRRGPSGFTQVVPVTYASAIRSGTSSNHLKVTRNGSQITLAVNGTTLGTWYDGAITGQTWVGLMSSPYSDVPVSDARFDNFSVTTLQATGAAVETGSQDSVTAQANGPAVTTLSVLAPPALEWKLLDENVKQAPR